jgi:hypothetical protein
MPIYKQQHDTKVRLGQKKMFKVYELNNLSELEGQGGYFRDLISTRGSIGLHADENEEPHSVDGVSYVIEPHCTR